MVVYKDCRGNRAFVAFYYFCDEFISSYRRNRIFHLFVDNNVYLGFHIYGYQGMMIEKYPHS